MNKNLIDLIERTGKVLALCATIFLLLMVFVNFLYWESNLLEEKFVVVTVWIFVAIGLVGLLSIFTIRIVFKAEAK